MPTGVFLDRIRGWGGVGVKGRRAGLMCVCVACVLCVCLAEIITKYIIIFTECGK